MWICKIRRILATVPSVTNSEAKLWQVFYYIYDWEWIVKPESPYQRCSSLQQITSIELCLNHIQWYDVPFWGHHNFRTDHEGMHINPAGRINLSVTIACILGCRVIHTWWITSRGNPDPNCSSMCETSDVQYFWVDLRISSGSNRLPSNSPIGHGPWIRWRSIYGQSEECLSTCRSQEWPFLFLFTFVPPSGNHILEDRLTSWLSSSSSWR